MSSFSRTLYVVADADIERPLRPRRGVADQGAKQGVNAPSLPQQALNPSSVELRADTFEVSPAGLVITMLSPLERFAAALLAVEALKFAVPKSANGRIPPE